MSRVVLEKKQAKPWGPGRATTLVLVVGTAALLAVNLYLLWVWYVPLHFNWQTLADPAVSERLLIPAEWLVNHVQYLRSMVPVPIDGNPPVPLTMVEPKTFYA